MPSDGLILGFDTSAAHCAAALLPDDGSSPAIRAEEMTRGQAERLVPLLEELLAENGAAWRDLAAIGVGVGPGNFTGIRIAVAAARGLALALEIPVIGVNGFDVIAEVRDGACLPVVNGPAGQLYARVPGHEPALAPRDEVESHGLPLCALPAPGPHAEVIARLARARLGQQVAAPAPLYIRPADAAPARDSAPRILDHDA